MSENHITTIIQAENEAEQIKQTALIQAANLIDQAQSKQTETLALIALNSTKKILLAEDQARKNQEKEIAKISQATDTQLDNLAKEKNKNISQAVEKVIQSIITDHVGS